MISGQCNFMHNSDLDPDHTILDVEEQKLLLNLSELAACLGPRHTDPFPSALKHIQ